MHARGEMYTDFDEESDLQVKIEQFRRPEGKHWEKLHRKIYFLIRFPCFLVFAVNPFAGLPEKSPEIPHEKLPMLNLESRKRP